MTIDRSGRLRTDGGNPLNDLVEDDEDGDGEAEDPGEGDVDADADATEADDGAAVDSEPDGDTDAPAAGDDDGEPTADEAAADTGESDVAAEGEDSPGVLGRMAGAIGLGGDDESAESGADSAESDDEFPFDVEEEGSGADVGDGPDWRTDLEDESRSIGASQEADEIAGDHLEDEEPDGVLDEEQAAETDTASASAAAGESSVGDGSSAGEPANSGPEPLLAADESIVDALVAELESETDDETRAELHEAIAGDHDTDTEVRLQGVESRLAELAAYKDGIEEFIDENGTGSDIVDDIEAHLDELDGDVDDIKGDLKTVIGELEDSRERADGFESDLTELSEQVDDLQNSVNEIENALRNFGSKVEELQSTDEDQAARMDELEDEIDDLDRLRTGLASAVSGDDE
jgi:methyl-accepting chemotaxis protein